MTLGNNAAGLLLALLTALFWGALPLAVKHVLPVMDAVTLVWLRFCVAAVWIWLIPAPGRRLRTAAPAPVVPPPPRLPLRRACLLLFVATAGLGANFVFFNSSVAYLSASACQILAQAGPVLLLLGGVFILREAFLPIQGVGVALLLAGLLLFFNTRLGLLWGEERGGLPGVPGGRQGVRGRRHRQGRQDRRLGRAQGQGRGLCDPQLLGR